MNLEELRKISPQAFAKILPYIADIRSMTQVLENSERNGLDYLVRELGRDGGIFLETGEISKEMNGRDILTGSCGCSSRTLLEKISGAISERLEENRVFMTLIFNGCGGFDSVTDIGSIPNIQGNYSLGELLGYLTLYDWVVKTPIDEQVSHLRRFAERRLHLSNRQAENLHIVPSYSANFVEEIKRVALD